MAKRTIIELTDDLDGGKADQTVAFSLDGTAYELDLSNKHASELRRTVNRYLGVARPANTGTGRSGRRAPGATFVRLYDPKTVRKWAASRSITVPARGRIPASVIAQFHAAGN